MQITVPDSTPFIEIARFAHSIGCDVVTRTPTELELLASKEAQALSRAPDRLEPRRA